MRRKNPTAPAARERRKSESWSSVLSAGGGTFWGVWVAWLVSLMSLPPLRLEAADGCEQEEEREAPEEDHGIRRDDHLDVRHGEGEERLDRPHGALLGDEAHGDRRPDDPEREEREDRPREDLARLGEVLHALHLVPLDERPEEVADEEGPDEHDDVRDAR